MSILDKLKEGDMRSIGRSDEVVNDVLAKPSLFSELITGLFNEDAGVRMRSADSLEKVTIKMPELLKQYKSKLILEASMIDQQEVRWHLAQIYPRLELSKQERDKVIELLKSWIKESKSNIVKVFSMQSLSDFAKIDASLKQEVIRIIKDLMKKGVPSLTSRGKRLLNELKDI